jgi:uncharacterized OB-fold protein
VGVAVFFLLALVVAGIVVYPLLPGRRVRQPAPGVADADIEEAVRNLRQARSRGRLACRQCGQGYQAGDRFCVRCGEKLPQAKVEPAIPVCPSCGATIHENDQFCAKCGHGLSAEEVA